MHMHNQIQRQRQMADSPPLAMAHVIPNSILQGRPFSYQDPNVQNNRSVPQIPNSQLNAAFAMRLLQLPTSDEVRRKHDEELRLRAAKSEQRRVQEERLLDEDVAAAYSESLSPEEGTFAEYSPAWVRNPAFRRHTDPVVESSSLASVTPPKPSFRLRLPLRTIVQGRLSDLQLEAILHACSQVRARNTANRISRFIRR